MMRSLTKTPTAVSRKVETIIKYQLMAGVRVTDGSIIWAASSVTP